MVRRRRIALGLPPVEPRRRRRDSEDEDDVDVKPVLYDGRVELWVGADGERPRWDQLRVCPAFSQYYP